MKMQRNDDFLLFKDSRSVPLDRDFSDHVFKQYKLLKGLNRDNARNLRFFVEQFSGNLLEAYMFGRLLGIKMTTKDISLIAKHRIIDSFKAENIIDEYMPGYSFRNENKENLKYDISKIAVQPKILKVVDCSTIEIDNSWSIVEKIDSDIILLKQFEDQHRILQKCAKQFQKRVNIPIRKFKRIFNKDLSGGRIYSNYQHMSSSLRQSILIDNESTVEVDYTANHMRMLLYIIGDEHNIDPYDGFDFERAKVKRAFNALFNSNNPKKMFCDQRFTSEFRWSSEKAEKFIADVIKKFPKLVPFVGKGISIKLQKIEGDIALDIMKESLYNDTVVLPIHDSFIVKQADLDWIEKEMDSKWIKNLTLVRQNPNFYF